MPNKYATDENQCCSDSDQKQALPKDDRDPPAWSRERSNMLFSNYPGKIKSQLSMEIRNDKVVKKILHQSKNMAIGLFDAKLTIYIFVKKSKT